ncbi:MAG: TolC family protein [Cryomorphaceae bacterium]|nr:TolC family protein [Cryomorphaceae bacterium]
MKRLIILLCLTTAHLSAQDILDFETFMRWVGDYHPIPKQASLTATIGRESVKAARGGFDPVAFASINEKVYNEVNYYQRQVYGVDIPTWAGLSVHGMMERNSGVYLNPEKTVPQSGLMTAGLTLNIGQGLLIDERRRALFQAKAFEKQTVAEQRKVLNNLYLEATHIYWQWALAEENFKVLQRGLEVTMERFEGIRESFLQGELPAIDTVEAYTQVQTIKFRLREQENRRYIMRQLVSTFTWTENEMPMELNEDVLPEPLSGLSDPSEIGQPYAQLPNHPELLELENRRDILNIERRWKAEQLKPILFLRYNLLSEDFNVNDHAFFQNNYSLGGGFVFPLFLRKERGNLNIVKSELKQIDFERELVQLQLRNELDAELNSLRITNEQVEIFQENVSNLDRLLRAEQTRFEIGESSIFLINARETSLLDGQVTLNQTKANYLINQAKVRVAAGIGWQAFE